MRERDALPPAGFCSICFLFFLYLSPALGLLPLAASAAVAGAGDAVATVEETFGAGDQCVICDCL